MNYGIEGGFGAFLDAMRDHKSRVPDEREHEELVRAVEILPDKEVRRRFVSLLEAVNPQANCICSDLRQVNAGDTHSCGYHTSRVGWIVHQARQLMPPTRE